MKSALAATLVLVMAVVIAVAAVPRSDLPPAVHAAKDYVDAVLDEPSLRVEAVHLGGFDELMESSPIPLMLIST